MTKETKDFIILITIGGYLCFGASCGVVAMKEIKKLQGELTALQYEVGVISASNNPK